MHKVRPFNDPLTPRPGLLAEWGFIQKRELAKGDQKWLIVEACISKFQGEQRAAELQKRDPSHEYRVAPDPGH